MEALQVTKYSIRQGQGLDFASAYNLDIKLDHLETLSAVQAIIPDGMDSFKEKLKLCVNDSGEDEDDDEGSEDDGEENKAGDTL